MSDKNNDFNIIQLSSVHMIFILTLTTSLV